MRRSMSSRTRGFAETSTTALIVPRSSDPLELRRELAGRVIEPELEIRELPDSHARS